jgi:hypothetical protein
LLQKHDGLFGLRRAALHTRFGSLPRFATLHPPYRAFPPYIDLRRGPQSPRLFLCVDRERPRRQAVLSSSAALEGAGHCRRERRRSRGQAPSPCASHVEALHKEGAGARAARRGSFLDAMRDASPARDTRPVAICGRRLRRERSFTLGGGYAGGVLGRAVQRDPMSPPALFITRASRLPRSGMSHGGVRVSDVTSQSLTSAPRQRRFSGPNGKSFTLDCSAAALEERIQSLHATAMDAVSLRFGGVG